MSALPLSLQFESIHAHMSKSWCPWLWLSTSFWYPQQISLLISLRFVKGFETYLAKPRKLLRLAER
ncbi:unnamed protein product [Chondrus crispus]|uniref:Uncharacterized protein n=1 Tax=Chondrus crispus TaxID=2769 RepID=R7QBM0_CHOCR|nr:unnamed protein product [Chondrus crispus]CDF35178.1 unnamed protein product [Chondrus crispus]|eukprot:XP_005714997.1 unnamed protein product [Chondrus crispus]